MNFTEAIKSVFSQYADFAGRASRSEYWYFVLFNVAVNILLVILGLIFSNGSGEPSLAVQVLSWLYSMAVLIPGLAVCIRRLHDVGKGGQWYFIGLIPIIGWIWLIVLFCQPSEPGDNRFGPNPDSTFWMDQY